MSDVGIYSETLRKFGVKKRFVKVVLRIWCARDALFLNARSIDTVNVKATMTER